MYLRILVQRGRADALCSSPRLSAGLMMLLASIAPSAEPAPTMVCNSSMKRMTFLRAANLVHHRLDALLELAAILGARHHQARGPDVMTFLSRRISGTLPFGDFLCQTFHDGGLAHARFADQHGVVLRCGGNRI